MLVEFWLRERVVIGSVWSCVQLFDTPPVIEAEVVPLSELPFAGYKKGNKKVKKTNTRRTIGDLDLVFEEVCEDEGGTTRATHWEVAIKYYIFDAKTLGSCQRIEELSQLQLNSFKGPKSSDTLERKARQCFSASCILATHPSAKESLLHGNIPLPTHSEIFVKGCLFYPYSMWCDQNLMNVPPELSESWQFQLNSKHWKGWAHQFKWTHINDNPSLCIPSGHLIAFLPKHDYMGPLRIFVDEPYSTVALGEPPSPLCSHPHILESPIELVTPDKAFDMLQQHFSATRLSIMLVHVKYESRDLMLDMSSKLTSDTQWVGSWVEVSRGFVVGDEWPFV
ncbi:hypothetical protein K7432_004319 [Basidiobolus ranarum]|uniref:Uncharacterized protein n=1 Tax=Basidiobolus ranarum TaxID=34480 RepID=A0ABR2W525_9FUNG